MIFQGVVFRVHVGLEGGWNRNPDSVGGVLCHGVKHPCQQWGTYMHLIESRIRVLHSTVLTDHRVSGESHVMN